MRKSNYFKKIFTVLFLFFSLPLFAQNQLMPQILIEKVLFLQKTLKIGETQKFAEELEYINVIRKKASEYSPATQNEYIKDGGRRIQEVFAHLQIESNENNFKNLCFKKIDRKENSLTKKCISTSWDGKFFLVTVGGESFDLSNKDNEPFEFGEVFVFQFDDKNNKLKLIDYGLAG